MPKGVKGKVTKERIAAVCKRVNNGEKPSAAINAERLGGTYLTSLKEAGIIYRDPLTRRWQGIMRIHDDRFERFIEIRKKNTKLHSRTSKLDVTIKKVRKPRVSKKQAPKVGMFRRIWNSIFG